MEHTRRTSIVCRQHLTIHGQSVEDTTTMRSSGNLKLGHALKNNTQTRKRLTVIHSTNTSVANTTMVAHGWFKRLTLPTHTVRGRLPTLFFLRNSRAGNRSRIGEGSLGMRRQRHGTEKCVYHSQDGGDALSNGKESHCNGRIRH